MSGTTSRPGSVSDLAASVDYFSASAAAFGRATAAVEGAETHSIDLAGYHVRLNFAGPAMVPVIMPALAHRVVRAADPPDFEIGIWDSASTGVKHPSPAWSAEDFRERGRIEGYNNERIRTCFQMGPDSLSLIDFAESSGYFWLRDADQVPYYETGAPLRNLFHWWLSQRDVLFVHAAAIGTDDGAGLLVGRGGSGKSTTALACLAGGLRYVSDDYCVVDLTDEASTPVVHSVYNTGKLTRDSVERFPGIAEVFDGIEFIEEDKRLFFLYPAFAANLVSRLPLRAVFVPKIVESDTTSLSPTSPVHALRALAPSSIFQLAGAGELDFERFARLVRSVPCLSLELGSDASQSAEVLGEYLSGARHG